MLTKNEITSLNLSPTKKDFVQIWTELLEVAGKLSERWDPTSTNESDPGIVILKALTGIADKLNYNIDKNTLEAFMPTAAQEDSMRKLCDMLGYSIKYYQSAQTVATIKYHNSDPSEDEISAMKAPGVLIPKFTVLTNSDNDISYFTINEEDRYISAEEPIKQIACMEGQIVKCESVNDNSVITANQISESNRFYLPETQIAENGIFVYNIFQSEFSNDTLTDGESWKKVDNLNTQTRGSRVFKFGFDSYEGRPYIEFPEDYSELFNEGLFIYYTRTRGINGNVSAGTLTQIELPKTGNWTKVAAESFSVTNNFAATTGSNVETIKQAYNNFKKTIGTFETLVTCRDYMNKIYLMTDDQTNKPLVSNILVTDIRSDLNRAVTICSCDDTGIFYKETPIILDTHTVGDPISKVGTPKLTDETGFKLVGKLEDYQYEKVDESETGFNLVGNEEDYEFEQVGEPIDSPATFKDKQIKDFETISDEEVTSTIVVDVNKPRYDTQGTVVTVGTSTRSTHWFLGQDSKIPIFADGRLGSFVGSAFDESLPPDEEPSAFWDSGEPSDYWIVKQGGKTYETYLPVTRVASTTRTILNQQTEEITNEVVRTVKEQRTLKEQNTVTVKEQRTLREQNEQTYTITNEINQEISNDYAIDHFDIVLYPFKAYTQLKNNVKDIRKAYDASFAYDSSTFDRIKDILDFESSKTIAHNVKKPEAEDIVSINNYLRLNATIATNSKITTEEGSLIIENIKLALANAFNMRELDFGEEIPFESIVEVMEKADARIKVVALNEPSLYTTFTKLKGYDENNVPQLVEYAVKSDPWLTPETAYATGRLGTARNGTFDINEAKALYNKLAVRNVLAGRLPLFNYNKTFSSSFYESACQETTLLSVDPSEILGLDLPVPTAETPYVVYVHVDGTIYTGMYEEVEDASAPNGKKVSITYYKTSTPSALKDVVEDNLITNLNDENIVEIQTDCNIKTDPAGENSNSNIITNVTLGENEYVKFRAPNFTTIKTYPAYVNYHLALDTELLSEAGNAKANTLFNLLDKDRTEWSTKNTDIGWQKVLDHFVKNKPDSVKTFTLSQKVSAYAEIAETTRDLCDSTKNTTGQHVMGTDGKTCKYCGKALISDELKKGPIIVTLDNDSYDTGSETISSIFAKSGFAKVTNNISYSNEVNSYVAEAILKWDTSDGASKPTGEGPSLPLQVAIGSSPFITDFNIFSNIQTAINEKLEELRGQTSNGKAALPTECDWTISFNFECVPFEPATLNEWERFVKTDAAKKLFGFTPVEETGTIFWRIYGEGYQSGKYVLESTEKLLKFDSNYFGSLPETRLKGIYLIEYPGKDSKAAVISNNSEYSLRANEYLYIEYTPSTASDDGTAQESTAVTEIYGPGTIIRPSGFTEGLMDSTYATSKGKSPFKNVTFDNPTGSGSITVGMQRFSANEQVEIRDLAKVELTKDSFKSSSAIYVYKNFSSDILEDANYVTANGQRVYTLKDGEYIFYTDQNQTELAYFTNGTQVSVDGSLAIPSFDTIDISDILNSGLNEIPWKRLSFSNNDVLSFQEYQYVTLGPGDTVKELTLTESTDYLGKQWQNCNSVAYSVVGSDDVLKLSPISIYDAQAETTKGNGWEAASVLELDVSSSKAQTLRNDGKVETSLTLTSVSASGGGEVASETIMPNTDSTLSIKTNLACYSSNSQISIDEVYSNPDGAEGFTFKVFTTDAPALVETAPGRVVPPHQAGITDLINWPAEDSFTTKDYSDLWTTVSLKDITTSGTDYDKALRLPINVLPNTYGVFCLYLKYYGDEDYDAKNISTWIEVLPGTRPEDITILNSTEEDYYVKAEPGSNKPDKLFLQPGINCIRVAKSGKIFIKASSGAQGTLYFDDLRLVDCQQLEYNLVNSEGKDEPVSSTTQGLNLQQLGYLLISDKDAATLDLTDDDVYFSIKADYLNQTYRELEEEAIEANKDFASIYDEVTSSKNKLQTLVNIEESIVKDLDYLCNTNNVSSQDLTDLVETYHSISDMLNKEQTLLDALTANKNIEASEQLLIQLMESLNITEDAQQQLKQNLELLIEQAKTSMESAEDTVILNDFTECLDTEEKNTAFESIKKIAKESLEENFNSQLEGLADSFEQLLGSDESNRLLTLLMDLHTSKSADKRAQLTTLITQLRSAVELDDLDGWLHDLESALASKDYLQVSSALLQIRNLLNTRDIKLIVSELEQATLENNDTHVRSLVEEIQKLVSSTSLPEDSTTDNTIKSLIETIDSLRSALSASTVTDEAKEQVKKDILGTGTEQGLITKISNFYAAQRDSLLLDILAILDELSNSLSPSESTTATTEDLLLQNINALKASLDDNKTYQLEDCIEQVNDIIDLYTDNVTAIEIAEASETWDENITEFIQNAIISIWPAYMKAKINSFIEQVNKDFSDAFKDGSDPSSVTTGFETLAESLTDTQQSIVGISSFEALFNNVSSVLSTSSQSRASIAIIENISSNISLPHDVSVAMQALQDTTSVGRNNIIIELISNILAADRNDVTKRRQLINSLKTELTNATYLNEQIIKALDSILYPSIFKFEASTEASDAFYEQLLGATKSTKESILKLDLDNLKSAYVNSSDDNTCYDYYYLEVLDTKTEDFREALLALNTEATTYLPTDFVKNVKSLKEAVEVLNDVSFMQEARSEDLVSSDIATLALELATDLIKDLVNSLADKLSQLEQGRIQITEEFVEAYKTICAEKQLLAEIKSTDTNREFFYTVPVEPHLAIDFNESDSKLNTLMNPLTYYDINNVNNNFVISKIDIEYLTKGLQIARSSRIN